MKVAHFIQFSPHRAGNYETAKEIVLAERLVGIDTQMIDYGSDAYPKYHSRVGCKDGDITTVAPEWAEDADILVRHSAIPKYLQQLGKPMVLFLHGMPEYVFNLEYTKKSKPLTALLNDAKNPDYKEFITCWPQNTFFWETLLNRKIQYCPAPVDLDKFNPKGKKYKFKKSGKVNIVVTNIWRKEYHTPFNVLFAAAKFIKEKCPDGKIHVFGVPDERKLYPENNGPVNQVLLKLREAGVLGDCLPLVNNLDEIYRAADMLVTPSTTAQRTVREALACGCPIVAAAGNPYTLYRADPRDTDGFVKAIDKCYTGSQCDKRVKARLTAEIEFDLERTGEVLKAIYEKIEPVEVKKVSLKKTKLYTFISYSTDKDLGDAYNQCMQLLGDDDWACLIDHDAMWTTKDWYNQLCDLIKAHPDYGCFTVMTNRIGNPEQKVLDIDSSNDIEYHRQVGKNLWDEWGTTTRCPVKQLLSGVVILVKKSVWKKVGGFKSGFLGVDNDFHKRLIKAKVKVGIAKGVYVYHWYRQNEFTGERVIQGSTPERIWKDHIARYEFAKKYVKDKRVLDIACGTGYGSYMLAKAGAKSVCGKDISEKALKYAYANYEANNLQFVNGNLLDIQSVDNCFDVITCFETIEHVENQEKTLEELYKVLKPGGILIISTPDRDVVSPGNGIDDKPVNKFHKREFTVNEFMILLETKFKILDAYGQTKGHTLEPIEPCLDKKYRYITVVCKKI